MKRYQAVAFLLSTAMTVSSVAPVFGASNDVFGHWAELTITKWQNEGRIGGYEDGTFKPDKAITRAEFVRLLNSAAPTAFTASTSINFSDVKESDWFYADVAKAVGGRVASGFEDGTFRPGETVTRMQAAVFICNAKGLTPNEAAANNFTDAAQIPSWAKGAVGAAVAAGYLSGYPDGSFGGSKGMTRAEAVSTLDRVLGGGSTTTTPSGEIDTTNRDNNHSTEDNRTAEAGNMVWTSGGSGGGSKKSSSSSSSSSSDKKTNNVTIRSQKEANEYEGKTLTGTTSIYVDGSGIDLKDIRFKGDVDIYADDTATAAAYIGEDTAVAAANSTVDIYFEGKTNVSGTITVIRNTVAGADKVVIKTRTPRALSASVLAKVATKIVGFELSRVEAQAPVEIAEGAKVNTVEAGDNAIVEVAADASVDKVDVTGDAKDIVLNGEGSTDVTVKNGASADQIVVDSTEATVELEGSAKVNDVYVVGDGEAAVKVNDNAKVENVQVSDSASADVAVADKAAIGTVKLSDTATAKVDVAPEAKVDTISSTSTGKTEVSGEGTVDKIEATNPSTVDTSNAGENIPTVDKKDETTTTPTPATKTITAAQLKDVALATATAGEKASVTGLPTGVTAKGTVWTEATASTPAAQADGDTTTTPGGDDTTTTPGGDDTTTTPGGDDTTTTPGGDDTTTTPETPATKPYTATITLTAETGYAFDTAIKKADFTKLSSAIKGDVSVSATEIKFTVKADIADSTTPPDEKDPTIKITKPADFDLSSWTAQNNTVTINAKTTDIADNEKVTWSVTGGKTGTEFATTDSKVTGNATSNVLTIAEGQTPTTLNITASYDGKKLGTTTLVLKKEFKGATAAAGKVEITGKIGQQLPADQKITVTLAKAADAEEGAAEPKFKAVTAEEAKKWITGLPEGITATATAIQENANSVEFTLSGTPTSKTGAVAIAIPAKYIVGQEDTSSETITAITTNVTFNIADGDIAATEITSLPAAVDMVAGTSFTTLEGKIIAKTGDDVHYTKGNIKWFSKDTNGSGNYTEATGKTALEGGKSYQVEITLNAATDWAFTDAAKTAITLPGSKTATGTLGADNKTLTFTVELGDVAAGPNQGTEVAVTATGKVTGTPTVDGTAGSINSESNKITITLTGDYKFSDTEVNKIATDASSLIKTPADTGLAFAAALKAGDNTAKTLEITVSGTPAEAITSDITIDDTVLKGLIVTSTGDALDKETVKTASTAKFAITASGGGNENADKVSAVVITEPTTDKTVNLNDAATDGATSATKNITIVTKVTEAELNKIAGLLTNLSITDVDSTVENVKAEIANKAKTAIETKITENTALKDIWTVKSVEVTTSGDITLEQNKETSINIKVVFSKGNVDISTTNTNSENREIKVTPTTTTSGDEPEGPAEQKTVEE